MQFCSFSQDSVSNVVRQKQKKVYLMSYIRPSLYHLILTLKIRAFQVRSTNNVISEFTYLTTNERLEPEVDT